MCVGHLGGLVEPVGVGFGGVSLSRGILTAVGVRVPVSLLGVGSAGACGVGLPISVLLEKSNLVFQGDDVLGTCGEMELEGTVGDDDHAVARELV